MSAALEARNANSMVREGRGALVEVRNLTMVYYSDTGETLTALEEVNFQVGEQEFLTIVGPSGCGKTTVAKIIGGLLPYTRGEVRLRGELVQGPQSNIGYVFQSPVLLKWRNVIENVLLPAEVLGFDLKVYRKKALELLELVRLQGFEEKSPWELSGGMQQRVSIARALIHDPSLLIMDEPFGALDAITREDMSLELLRIWQERQKTVIFITHSIAEAALLGDRVIVMTPRPGRVRELVVIDLPRPRGKETRASREYVEYIETIRRLIA